MKYIHSAKSAIINFVVITVAVALFAIGMIVSSHYGH